MRSRSTVDLRVPVALDGVINAATCLRVRRRRTACRAPPSCRRRFPRTTRRPPRGSRGGGWPAARARATSRSRSSRLTTRIGRACDTRVSRSDASPPAASSCCRSSSKRCSSSPSNVIDFRNRAGMMRSVSMLSPRSGRAGPRMLTNLLNRHQLTAHRSSRTSTTSPATAAAATIAGLISSVRPVGLPCRPLKFRFDDDAQISRPSSRSGFIARHIEQPAPRHSNPASMKTRSSPSRSAASRTPAIPARPAPARAAPRDVRGRRARPRADRTGGRSCTSRRTRRRSACR